MSAQPQRKNNPDATRASLLDCAAQIIVEDGMAALTLDNVARRARVSKGGLLHHYPGKEALVSGLFEQVVAWFDGRIDALIDPDKTVPARFSRAYLGVIASIDMNVPEEKRLAVLMLMLSSDPHFCARWNQWVEARLHQHRLTDRSAAARTLRLVADGLWLSDLGGGPDSSPSARRHILQFLESLVTAQAVASGLANKGIS
ncbi:TetR/AcrR family transcriptional regulator [Hoeflea sp.]|uniref:TetR/AcrR family transcriptional regulator n=1 Tax=Hoeflea sp. TaxID=1940281 RepID=UPI003A903DA8